MLGEHFMEGPAPRSEKQIDVIIAPDSCMIISSRSLVAILIRCPDPTLPQF